MRTVLISGASVAGPSLAYWLARHGFDPTVVEVAPALRGGGYAVDFRDEAHLTVLDRMGVLGALREAATGGSPMSFIDESGTEAFALPPEFAGGDVEVRRSDLARVLHDRTKDSAEYLFGDSIAALDETPEGVRVAFAGGVTRTFDLVVGADGLHSNVRRLAFGPEEEYLTHLGFYLARWPLPGHGPVGRTALMCNTPGRLVSLHDDHEGGAEALVAWASGRIEYDRRDPAALRKIIREVFTGMGWRTAEFLDALDDADGLYFDSISRIDVPAWSRGRVALAGDAAHGATLGGMGTGTAVVGAYVLAGELAAARDSGAGHQAAYAAYESRLREFAVRCQEGGERTGAFLAPPTAEFLAGRDEMMRRPGVLAEMLAAGAERAAGIELPAYGTV